jgi:hypothetical protein
MNAVHVEIGKSSTQNLKAKSLALPQYTRNWDCALVVVSTVFKPNQTKPVQCGSRYWIKKEFCRYSMMAGMTISHFYVTLLSIAIKKNL